MKKEHLKKEIKKLLRSMDYVSNFLNNENISEKDLQIFFRIYQQLGLAWEFLGLRCGHWEGYKKTKNNNEVCKICGKVKGVDDSYYLFPKEGPKKLGTKLKPNSKKTFENKREAKILNDTINFHGALIKVDIHNSYKSTLTGHRINIAADRIVQLKERCIECYIDRHLINITVTKEAGKKLYGGFPWEIRKKDLENFPVIFDFDENHRFMGLTILR